MLRCEKYPHRLNAERTPINLRAYIILLQHIGIFDKSR